MPERDIKWKLAEAEDARDYWREQYYHAQAERFDDKVKLRLAEAERDEMRKQMLEELGRADILQRIVDGLRELPEIDDPNVEQLIETKEPVCALDAWALFIHNFKKGERK